ncbi:family 16 glycoside hydrolase [Streptomyces hokutonensis]|uniref:family 16 glycoside hydrolase n=1 Tax=Streptomyces hokutonensis TaxID=1306990 RepID=UPI0033C9355C
MPKTSPDLPRLVPATAAGDRVQVQQTAFSYDVMGRYVCNDWEEVQAQVAEGGFPFDAVVIGAGMFGGYCAEKLYSLGKNLGLRILVLDAGAFLSPTHLQNLPHRLGGNVGAPAYNRKREDGTGTQNVVWGIPWISNEAFPGLAYCLGGRSLFWGGWSPRLTGDDLASWPPDVVSYLTNPGGYDRTEVEIGTVPTADYMEKAPFHNALKNAFSSAIGVPGGPLADIEEAPLAVQGSSPGSGIFPFAKFSSASWLMDAVRDDATFNIGRGDVSRRLFVVPRTQVLGLSVTGGRVTGIDITTDGIGTSLPIPSACAVVLAAGTIENTRLALTSLGVGDTTFGSPRLGNLTGHLRSNITVRIRRTALGIALGVPDLETTAFLVRGAALGRRFHLQVSAAGVGSIDPERNMWEMVPDIDTLDQIRANEDPDWITMIFRCIGEMTPVPSLVPNPARSWIDLSPEADPMTGTRRAYVNLVAGPNDDMRLWTAMDKAAFDLAEKLSGGDSKNIEYLDRRTGTWLTARPQPDATGGGSWRDPLGSTHHEAGTLFMGPPGSSITDTTGRFHEVPNAYVAGPALFPTLGSANPSLTALTLARRTAQTIVTERTTAPLAGFTPLSLASDDWTMVAAPGTNPAIRRLGPLLETSGGYGLSWYKAQEFGDAALWIEWRQLHRGDNSGIYVRTPGPAVPDALHQADVQGHEIQIDDLGAGNPSGLDIHRTGAVYGLQAPAGFPARPAGEWNAYLIETTGPRVRVTLNNVLVNDYTSNRRTRGFLALQAHSGTVQFRNLQAKSLP